MTVESGPQPIHCRATHDCQEWTRNTAFDVPGGGHSKYFHDIADSMISRFWAWMDASISCLRADSRIRHCELPNPSDPDRWLTVGIVDPTTVTVLLAVSQAGGHEANGAYVGLAAQDTTTGWRGLTGFYLPWCPGCHEQGDAVFKELREGLARRSVSVISVWELPPGLWPRRGWFDGDRLQLGGFVAQVRGVETEWRYSSLAESKGAALVATGPTTASLANLVLVPSLARSAPRLRELRPNIDAWVIKRGPMRRLEALAGLEDGPLEPRRVTVDRPSRAPAAWGIWRLPHEDTWHGPVPSVWLDLHEQAIVGRQDVEVLHLPEFTPARLSDIDALNPETYG